MARPGNGVGATHVDPRLNDDRSDRVDDDDRVVVVRGDGLDEVVAVEPGLGRDRARRQSVISSPTDNKTGPTTHGEVLPVPNVAVHGDVLLSRVRVDEHEGGVASLCGRVGSGEIKVVEMPRDRCPVLSRLGLDSLERRDEVGVVGGTGSPSLGEDAVDAAVVGVAVRSLARLEAEKEGSARSAREEQRARSGVQRLTGPASSPMSEIDRRLGERGRAPFLFLSSTVEAAPIFRITLQSTSQRERRHQWERSKLRWQGRRRD